MKLGSREDCWLLRLRELELEEAHDKTVLCIAGVLIPGNTRQLMRLPYDFTHQEFAV